MVLRLQGGMLVFVNGCNRRADELRVLPGVVGSTRGGSAGCAATGATEAARARAIELGVQTNVVGSDRNRPDKDIFIDMIEQTALRRDQRIEEIRNTRPPIEPIPEESGEETERETFVGRMGGAETEPDTE